MSLHRLLDTPLGMTDTAAYNLLHSFKSDLWKIKKADRPSRLIELLQPTEAVLVTSAPSLDNKLYEVVDGVAIIPVNGTLGNDFFADTTYAKIGEQFGAAMDDDSVRGIAMHIASPGGLVSGLFELVDTISSAKGKPIWSILDDHAYSAAYAIASVTDFITVPRAGGIGSVGVITMHLDVSKFIEDLGFKLSIVQFGDRKSDYSMFKPLSDGARERLQADVNTVGQMFIDSVSKGRKMPRGKVRGTEAGIYMGAAGVEVGFADAVMSPQDALTDLIGRVN